MNINPAKRTTIGTVYLIPKKVKRTNMLQYKHLEITGGNDLGLLHNMYATLQKAYQEIYL